MLALSSHNRTTDTASCSKTKEHDEHKSNAAPMTLQYKLADRTLLPFTGSAIDSPPDSNQRFPLTRSSEGFAFPEKDVCAVLPADTSI